MPTSRRITWIFVLALTVWLSSCSYFAGKKRGDIVAKAYDKLLYRSELKGVVPSGTPAADSAGIVKQYIDNWIRRQVLLHQAESNLSPEQINFTEQLETYRNSLVLYAYESELIRQKLDTVVSQQEIESFYNDNPGNFQLAENIVKLSFMKVLKTDTDKPLVKKASRLLESGSSQDFEKLDELCQSSVIICSFDDDNWMTFADMQRILPVETDNQEEFLASHHYYETSDSANVYYIRFTGYKMRESLAPLRLETENIRNIIINRRKLDLIHRMEQDVFQKALENKEFEIF